MHLILTIILSLQAQAFASGKDLPDVKAADAAPAQSAAPAEPARPENPAVPEKASGQPGAAEKAAQQPAETGPDTKPADTPAADKAGRPPAETPSGTKPAEPAVPGETPAKPAEPGNDKGPKAKRVKPDRSAMSKAGKSLGLSGAVPPAAGAALAAPLVPAKKESPAEEVAVSTAAAAARYSQGEGPALVVLDFEGENGAEFAGLLAEALKPGRKLYDRDALAGRNYGAVTRVSAKKIAAETGAAYLVVGKISKKTDSLYIVTVGLRDGASGDVKSTDFVNVKSLGELGAAASPAAGAVAAALEKLKN